MQLFINKPMQKISMQIAWLDIETPVGNFVIQPEHAPMIVALLPDSSITYCLGSGKHESINIKRGLAHITRDSVTLLISE